MVADHKAEQSEEGGNPERVDHVEVIGHCPDECLIPDRGSSHGLAADTVVFGEQEGSSSNEHADMEQAQEEREVDRADSPSVSPGADEYEEGVETP